MPKLATDKAFDPKLALTPSPLSILQVCSASQATYGAVQSLMTLARSQREAGHRVEFVTFAGKEFGRQVEAAGFRVHEVAVRTKIDALSIAAIRRIILRGKFDIVHTHLSTSSLNGCIAARLAGVPGIATVHGLSGKLSFVPADHLIAVSKQVKQHLIDQKVSADKISVVYNGLPMDVPQVDKMAARAELGLPLDATIIGTISRVTPNKGIQDAIRAIAILAAENRNLRYVVVGDGDGLAACKALAEELGISDLVVFLGYRTDITTCLGAMDLFLFPSHKEAMGIALVEAMRAGLPTVGTNIGGIPEVITPECGILVPPSNPQALANAVGELLADPKRMAGMGVESLHRVGRVFSAGAMQGATDWVYRTQLGQEAIARSALPVS